MNAIVGIALTTLLISMWFLGAFILPVLAVEYKAVFGDGNWTCSDCGCSGNAFCYNDTDKGQLQLLAQATVAEASAWGYVWMNFTYTGDTWCNWFELRYKIVGDITIIGTGHAYFTVKVELWDRESEQRLRYEIDFGELYTASELIRYGNRPVKFAWNLVQNKEYGIRFIASAYAWPGSSGSAEVDFFIPSDEINLNSLTIWHTHTPPTTTTGGSQADVEVRGEYSLTQNQVDYADELNFTSYNKDAKIKGWSITITEFAASTSGGNGNKAVDVSASEPPQPISRNSSVDVKVTQWLDEKNSMGLKNVEWGEATKGAQAQTLFKAMPDHHWSLGYPIAVPGQPGNYSHRFVITNDDFDYTLSISALSFLPTMTLDENLATIQFTEPVYHFVLPPMQSWVINIITDGDLIGGHIYFKYSIDSLDGSEVVCNAWGDHPVTSIPPAVGGIWVPVDKLSLLAPYIGLASTILVATVATAFYVKRVKRRKEKQ